MIKNRDLLKAFEKTVECGTVHAAAKELSLTQTAVTQRLKLLEEDIGASLFTRSRKGMVLTAEGSLLLQYAQELKSLDGKFRAKIFGESRESVHLTVVGPTSVISTRIARSCEKLYFKYPFLNLHLQSGDQADRVELVKSGKAELAIVAPQLVPNELTGKKLQPDRYLLVASAKWKSRKLADILKKERIVDFSQTDETTFDYLKQFGFECGSGRPRLFVNENEALIHFFKTGIGFGVLTEEIARPHIESGKLIALNRGSALEDPLALVWYPREQMPDYLTDIISAIR